MVVAPVLLPVVEEIVEFLQLTLEVLGPWMSFTQFVNAGLQQLLAFPAPVAQATLLDAQERNQFLFTRRAEGPHVIQAGLHGCGNQHLRGVGFFGAAIVDQALEFCCGQCIPQ